MFSKDKVSFYQATPLMLLVFLLPITVYAQKVVLSGAASEAMMGAGQYVDLFCHAKMRVLLALIIISWAVFFFKWFKSKGKPVLNWFNGSLALYALLIGLSAILSDYPAIAWQGIPQRFEGAIVLFAYISLPILTYSLLTDYRSARAVLLSLGLSSLIVAIVGLMQFAGSDPFLWQWVQNIIVPDSYTINLKPLFTKGICYATLYNPNYVGVFSAMIFVMSAVIFVFTTKTNLWKLLLIGILSGLMWALLIASNSRAGLIASIISLILVSGIWYKEWWPNKMRVLYMLLIMAIVFIFLNGVSQGRLIYHITHTVSTTQSAEIKSTGPVINKIEMQDKGVQFITDRGLICLKPSDGGLQITDGYQVIGIKQNGNVITLDDKRFTGFKLELYQHLFRVLYDRYDLAFVLSSGSIYNLTYRGEQIILNSQVQHWNFVGHEKLFSGRGYIWSRTIPLIKSTLLLGHGPDTFEYYFPYHDYLGKVKAGMTTGKKIESPHNQYLQMAVNTGLVSVIAFISIICAYLLGTLKLIKRANNIVKNQYYLIGLACFTAVVSYSISAFAVDSSVSVAPIFWTILGIGMFCNRQIEGALHIAEPKKKK